tara:strand:- start:5293 stop:5829 length:537 start_codon:yes stop_codon:yes gene_type:complete
MKILIIIVLIIFSNSIFALQGEGKYKVQSAKITYNVKHLLKNIKATSTNVKGVAVCSTLNCKLLIATPVNSFISKDSNRDLNMLTYTKASKYPMIQVRTNIPTTLKNNQFVNLKISFAGIDKEYKEIKLVSSTDDSIVTKGTILLKLSDFNIEKPSLLGISIENIVPINISIHWSKID